jgi:hypothetical protein
MLLLSIIYSLMKRGDQHWFNYLWRREGAKTAIRHLSLFVSACCKELGEAPNDLSKAMQLRSLMTELVKHYLPIHQGLLKKDLGAVIGLLKWSDYASRRAYGLGPSNQKLPDVPPGTSEQFMKNLLKIFAQMALQLQKVNTEQPDRALWQLSGLTPSLEELSRYLEVLNLMDQGDPRVTTAMEELKK